MKTSMFGILLAVGAVAPALGQDVYRDTDKFTGATAYHTELRSADLEGGSFWTSRFVRFRFSIVPAANGKMQYALAVVTMTPDWIFIPSGQSLTLKIDGQKFIPLTSPFGSSPSRQVISGTSVWEKAAYLLSPSDLSTIYGAKSVEFRLSGDRDTVDGKWDADLIKDAAAIARFGAGQGSNKGNASGSSKASAATDPGAS